MRNRIRFLSLWQHAERRCSRPGSRRRRPGSARKLRSAPDQIAQRIAVHRNRGVDILGGFPHVQELREH